jgi:hypothetical protein
MSGHRPVSELTRNFTPERLARVVQEAAALRAQMTLVEELREQMTLEETRKARSLSQEDVAASLGVGQPAVAKFEKRADMHVSTLRRYIEALGGTLEITARFGDASVVIGDFGGEPLVEIDYSWAG